jgi:CelD/BcsL family acetyltransferase involved in cellulose biosynthesis
MLRVEVIHSFADLLSLKTEWLRLAEANGFLAPSQSPDWLLTWWKHFGSGELRTFVFRSDGRLAGVVPCFLHEWEGKRQLTLMGSGVSDYLEPPIASSVGDEVVRAAGRVLQDQDDWDVCNWQDLNADTPLAQVAGEGLTVSVQDDTECSECLLTGDFNAYWAERPHGLRRNVRRYLEKARLIAEPQFVVSLKPDTEVINALTTLHTTRWQTRGEPGMIVENRSAAFVREVALVFANAGSLLLFSLRFQGRVVAVILAFLSTNTVFSYLSAFDPEYEALGFGRTLLYNSLQYAFEQRYHSWNFLRGNEPYKLDWGAKRIAKRRVIITRES